MALPWEDADSAARGWGWGWGGIGWSVADALCGLPCWHLRLRGSAPPLPPHMLQFFPEMEKQVLPDAARPFTPLIPRDQDQDAPSSGDETQLSSLHSSFHLQSPWDHLFRSFWLLPVPRASTVQTDGAGGTAAHREASVLSTHSQPSGATPPTPPLLNLH